MYLTFSPSHFPTFNLEVVVNSERDVVAVEVHTPDTAFSSVFAVILLIAEEANMCNEAEFVKL